MAGVQVSSEAVDTYNQLRFGKDDMKYFTCKLSSDMTEVVVDTIGSSTASWEEMEAALPKNECRYVFFHFDYEHDGGKRLKIVFVTWCPETSGIKQKMVYATTNQTLKKLFEGIGCHLQATDASEVEKSEVLARLIRV